MRKPELGSVVHYRYQPDACCLAVVYGVRGLHCDLVMVQDASDPVMMARVQVQMNVPPGNEHCCWHWPQMRPSDEKGFN